MTRVLVVGCDPEHRRQLTGILESAGFAVSGACHGEQVAAQAGQADAVIVDVASLGHRYGREVHRLLRTDARTTRLPILLVGWQAARLELEAGLVGASYYLTRPFTASVLLSRLSHLIMHAAVATAALAGLSGPVQTGHTGADGCTPTAAVPGPPAGPPP